MIIAYIIMLAIAIILLFAYVFVLYRTQKEKGLLVLHISVCLVNLGYLLLSLSPNVEFALWANKLAYLGQIAVIVSMLNIIIKLCGFKRNKVGQIIIISISAIMFAIVFTSGFLPWYYKSVSLSWENGGAELNKEYGPLHITYLLYVVAAFIAMITAIVYSMAMKKKGAHKDAGLLIAVVFIFFFWTMQDYVRKDEVQSPIVVVDSMPISEKMKIVCCRLGEDKKLTMRQTQILELILDGKTRKEIASKLIISENTVKMHTSMLYEALGVKNKEDIFAIVYKDKQ